MAIDAPGLSEECQPDAPPHPTRLADVFRDTEALAQRYGIGTTKAKNWSAPAPAHHGGGRHDPHSWWPVCLGASDVARRPGPQLGDLPEQLVPVRPTLVVLDESADLLGGVGLAKPEAQRVREAGLDGSQRRRRLQVP